jgi:cytochrome c-type biogenesis protein CcmH
MRRLLVTALVGLALAAPAAACTEPRASVTALEGQLMCPTCNTTLDQSDSAIARRLRAYIHRRVDECATGGQIKQELVDQFGPAILAAPPKKGFDLLAWWLPLGGILIAAAAIGAGVWRWSRRREPEPVERLDDEAERRVDEALAGFDG